MTMKGRTTDIKGLRAINRQLQKEILNRQKSEEKVMRINSLLKATSSINKLAIRTRDKKKLLSQACRVLVRTHGLHHAWIALTNGSPVPEYLTQYGAGKAWREFREQLADGKVPYCMRDMINTREARIITDPSKKCRACSLYRNDSGRGSVILPIQYESRLYGALGMAFPDNLMADNPGELEMLQEVADDMAFSLSKMRSEEESEQRHSQFLAVFEGIADLMYVSDPESYELLYMNPAFKSSFGAEVTGKKCHRIIHNLDKPCKFCTNEKIFGRNYGKTHIWEYRNERNGRWYRCSDRAIDWPDGRRVRFEIAADISEQKLSRELIEKQAYALNERLKEAECTRRVLEIINEPERTVKEVLSDAVLAIPAGWQYPEISSARITFNGREYISERFKKTSWKQATEINIPGKSGRVEVFYSEQKPEADEGPFLQEERQLIENLGRILENYLFKHQVNEELQLKTHEYYSLYEEYQAQNEELKTINEELTEEIGRRRMNEEKLSESEAKYRTLVENIPQKIFLKDRAYRWVSVNENMARDLNIRPEEIRGKVDADFFPEELAAKYRADDERIMKTGKTEDIVERYPGSGGYTWVHTIKTPVHNEKGEITGVLGIFWDVTEQKRNEEELKHSLDELKIRNRLAEVFLKVHDDSMFDEVLKIILEAMESKFGVFGYIDKNGDLIVPTMTRHIWDQCSVPEKDIRFPQTSWKNSNSSWPTALREKRPVHSNEPSEKTPEGHVKISRHLSVPLVHKGKSIGLLQVANKKNDYTENNIGLLVTLGNAIAPILAARLRSMQEDQVRRVAERALRESEGKYRTLLENIPQKIFVKDMNFRWVSVNENMARDLNIRPEEVVGKVDSDFFPEELAAKYRADDIRILETGKTEDIEERYTRDGEYFWVHTIKTPVKDDEGNNIGILGIFWDITEQKRSQIEKERLTAEVIEKNRELEQIVYVTSHDLRSPLVNIQGFSRELEENITELGDLLEEKDQTEQDMKRMEAITGEEIPEALRYINSSILKMDGLLKGLLTLSRVGRIELEMENIDMKKLLEEITLTLDYKIKTMGIELKIGHLPDCRGDKKQLNQVFSNLVENAIKYLDPERKGRIKIYGRKVKDRILYCVQDNGIGIQKEFQENIFKLFHKLKGSSEGEGLGLSIVKKIIERHNGEVWVESVPGKGSKFYISLI